MPEPIDAKTLINAKNFCFDIKRNTCFGCPYRTHEDCSDEMLSDAINMIESQQSRIEELEKELSKAWELMDDRIINREYEIECDEKKDKRIEELTELVKDLQRRFITEEYCNPKQCPFSAWDEVKYPTESQSPEPCAYCFALHAEKIKKVLGEKK